MNEQENYVLDKIIEITKDTKSRKFWKKAIKKIGPNKVELELGELKIQVNEGRFKDKTIKNKGAYLTTLLKKQMNNTVPTPKTSKEKKDKMTPYENTQRDLLKHLMPKEKREEKDIIEAYKMNPPYSDKYIPQPTFIGPQFFTLSSNKNKSDTVMAKFVTKEGTFNVPLTRGKVDKKSEEEFGILTVRHKKILDALKVAWTRKGGDWFQDSKGNYYCKVVVAARELANILKWKKFGGNTIIYLKGSIQRIKASPYGVDIKNSDISIPGVKNYHFSLIDSFSSITLEKDGQETTYFSVVFSSTVSWQLIRRKAVSRSLTMLEVKSELTHLIWSYVEPTLRKYGKVNINLSTLIEVLQLPEANWHEKKRFRKRQFKKAIKELNGQKLADGRRISASIEEGLQDYVLVVTFSKTAIIEE